MIQREDDQNNGLNEEEKNDAEKISEQLKIKKINKPD